MHILLCPDSFKGNLSSPAVAHAMAIGAHRACPSATIEIHPMADGGEGTAAIVNEVLGGKWRQTRVRGAHGQPVCAGWGYIADHNLAVLDVAAACGLGVLSDSEPDIWRRDTRGVGELILAALDVGATRLVVGLGGSATNDAGAGMLAALGVVFEDRDGHALPPNPAALGTLYRVDCNRLDPRLATTRFTALTDVDNPLTGPQGASAIFGPQKGLPHHRIDAMDTRIHTIARRIQEQCPRFAPLDQPGNGSAGGLGFALIAALGAKRRMGSGYIAELTGLDDAIARADLILTGEGTLDRQTGRGKVISEVARRAQIRGKPVIAIAGAVHATPREIHEMGLAGAESLCNPRVSVSEAMARSAELIAERTRQVITDWCTPPGSRNGCARHRP